MQPIIELLVNGTPPKSLIYNIVATMKEFSPTTNIKELPKFLTFWWAQTILLVVVQTLVAKADKWKQIFTEGTSWEPVVFHDFVMSIEESELFMWALQISSGFMYAHHY